MVRGALKALLAREGDIEIVAEADRADQVVFLALDVRPDVALLDFRDQRRIVSRVRQRRDVFIR